MRLRPRFTLLATLRRFSFALTLAVLVAAARAEARPELGQVNFSSFVPTLAEKSGALVIAWATPLRRETSDSQVMLVWEIPGAPPRLHTILSYDTDPTPKPDHTGVPITDIERDGDTFRATWDTSAVAPGTYYVTVSVTAPDDGHPDFVRSTAPGAIVVPEPARLAWEVKPSAQTVAPGETFTLSITVKNTGPQPSRPVTLNVLEPEHARFVRSQPPHSEHVESQVICELGTVPAGQTAEAVFNFTATARLGDLPLEALLDADRIEEPAAISTHWTGIVRVVAPSPATPLAKLDLWSVATGGRSVTPGGSHRVSAYLRNQGDGPSGPVTLRFRAPGAKTVVPLDASGNAIPGAEKPGDEGCALTLPALAPNHITKVVFLLEAGDRPAELPLRLDVQAAPQNWNGGTETSWRGRVRVEP